MLLSDQEETFNDSEYVDSQEDSTTQKALKSTSQHRWRGGVVAIIS